MKLVAHHGGADFQVEVDRHGSGYRVAIDGREHFIDMVATGQQLWSLRLEDGTQFAVTHHRSANEHELTLGGSKAVVTIIDPLALRRTRSDETSGAAGTVDALMPGRIVRTFVAEGDTVTKGTGLLILEAMKMENEIQAPTDGIVEQLFVKAGDTVDRGAPLIRIG